MASVEPKVIGSRQVFLRTAFYLLGGVLQKGAQLLLLPLLMAALTPEEFSRFGLMVSAVAILAALLSLNAHLSPARLYFDYERSHRAGELLLTCLLGAVGLAAVGLTVCVVVFRLASVTEPVSLGSLAIQLWVSLLVLAQVSGDFGLTWARVRGKAVLFSAASAVSGFGILAAFVALGPWIEDGLLRCVLAMVAGKSVTAGILLVTARKDLRGARFRVDMLRRSLAYSWPMTVHGLALWAVMYSGQWIGSAYLPLEDLAPYVLVLQIAGAMMMVGRSWYEARLPDIGRAFAAGQYRAGARIINRTMLASLATVAGVYVALYLGLFVFGLSLPTGYAPTPLLVLLAATANLFDLFYYRGARTLVALKKTGTQAAATVTAGAVTIAASFLLVRSYGDLGLASGVVVGMAAQAVMSNVMAVVQLARSKSS